MTPVNGPGLEQLLIDEGARLLAEQGPAGLSLRKLAAAAGTSTMAVYSRFGDKQGLLAAMNREGFRRLGERLKAAAADLGPDGGLAALGRAYRLSALENPHLYGLMFGPPPLGWQRGAQDDEAADATYLPLVERVRTAVDDGILIGEPERIARQLWVVAHGMVSLELAGQLRNTVQQPADAYDDALFCAITPFLPAD
jgi:AcrR family transcriptional regulator